MSRVEMSARISNADERRAVMAWVRAASFNGYSEIGDTVSVTFVDDLKDPENNNRKWGAIHFFEQYPEHSIHSTEN